MSAHTASAHTAHRLPQGETGAHTAAHSLTETLGLRAQTRGWWLAIPLGIRVGGLATLAGFVALALFPAIWLVACIVATVGILTTCIAFSVRTGERP